MKVKVVRTFRDKHTNEIHRVGRSQDTIIEVSEERFEEIESVGHFVEKVDGRTVRTVSNTVSDTASGTTTDTKKAATKATTKTTTKAKTATKADTDTKTATKADTDTKKAATKAE